MTWESRFQVCGLVDVYPSKSGVFSPDWSNFSSPIRRICGWSKKSHKHRFLRRPKLMEGIA